MPGSSVVNSCWTFELAQHPLLPALLRLGTMGVFCLLLEMLLLLVFTW